MSRLYRGWCHVGMHKRDPMSKHHTQILLLAAQPITEVSKVAHSVSMASTACVLSAVEPVAHATSSRSVERTSGRDTAPRPRGSSTLKQKASAPSSLPLQHCACTTQDPC